MVGLGRVNGSQNTTPLDALLGLVKTVPATPLPPLLSTLSLPTASIELCETPVE